MLAMCLTLGAWGDAVVRDWLHQRELTGASSRHRRGQIGQIGQAHEGL